MPKKTIMETILWIQNCKLMKAPYGPIYGNVNQPEGKKSKKDKKGN